MVNGGLVLLLLVLVVNDVRVMEQVRFAYNVIDSADGDGLIMQFQWQCVWCCCCWSCMLLVLLVFLLVLVMVVMVMTQVRSMMQQGCSLRASGSGGAIVLVVLWCSRGAFCLRMLIGRYF